MRQRAMIAMALSCDPDLLIADEPTTALDVTVQAQILDLIRDLQAEFNSAVILITHDLGVVAELADDILVMYAGRAVEYSSADALFNRPLHPYTWGLLGSVPRFDETTTERLLSIKGSPPSLINVPSGCAFHPRCDYAGRNEGRSETDRPELTGAEPGHLVACHLSRAERRADLDRRDQAATVMGICDGDRPRRDAARSEDLVKHFPIRKGTAAAPGRGRAGRRRAQLRHPAEGDVLDRR